MKVSELILKLENFKVAHGDADVFIDGDFFDQGIHVGPWLDPYNPHGQPVCCIEGGYDRNLTVPQPPIGLA